MGSNAGQEPLHVSQAQAAQRCPGLFILGRCFQLSRNGLPLSLKLFYRAKQCLWGRSLGQQTGQLLGLPVNLDQACRQLRPGSVPGGGLGLMLVMLKHRPGEIIAGNIPGDHLNHSSIHFSSLDALALASPVVPRTVHVPLRTVWRHQQPSQQIRPGSRLVPGIPAGLHAVKNSFGLVVGDKRFVGVALDNPIRPCPVFIATDITAMFGPLGMAVPYGMPGIGQGVALHTQQRGDRPVLPNLFHRSGAWHSSRPVLQIGTNQHGIITRGEFGLGDRLAFAHGSGGKALKPIAFGRRPASTEALPHVLTHAGQALRPGRERVPFIHRLQDRLQQHFGDWVGLGQRLVENAHPGLLAFVFLEDDRQMAAAGNAGGVEHQDGIPTSARISEGAQHGLKARAIVILAGLYRVSKIGNDSDATGDSHLDKLAALGVDGHIGAVFGATEVECGWHPASLADGDCGYIAHASHQDAHNLMIHNGKPVN